MAALRLLRQSYLRILPSHFGRNFEIPNNSFISQSLSTDATREEFDVSTDEDTGNAERTTCLVLTLNLLNCLLII